MQVISRTHVGLVRENNEDALLVREPSLFAVADGMGGHEAGEVASEIAINTIMELAPDHADSDALARAVIAANLNVIKAQKALAAKAWAPRLPPPSWKVSA